MKKKTKIWDTIIIGSGPAGLMASVYASRYRLSNLVIGKLLGGAITLAYKVENFPGFVSISGQDLAQKMGEQAKALGGEIISEIVDKIEKKGKTFFVRTKREVFTSKTLIVATGTERRKLDV